MHNSPFQLKQIQMLHIKPEHRPQVEINKDLMVVKATIDQVETIITVPVGSLINNKDSQSEVKPKPQRIVSSARKRNYTVSLGKNRIGELNGMAKLNEAQVREIRQMLSDKGYTATYRSKTEMYIDLAKAYNVSHSCIMLIDTNRTWKHVTV